MKKRKFSAKSCGFLGSNRFRNYNNSIITRKRTNKKIWTELSSSGQEPTFKRNVCMTAIKSEEEMELLNRLHPHFYNLIISKVSHNKLSAFVLILFHYAGMLFLCCNVYS